MWKVRRRWLPHREGVGVRARFRRVTRRKDRRRQSPPPEGTAVTRVDPKKVPDRSKDKDRWYDRMDVTGGCLDSVDEMWVLAVAVIVFMLLFFVVPPVVLIGVDLLWMGAVFLIGAVGRFALGRPWTVEAVGPDDERRAWQVKGFRGAGQLRDALQTEFDVGLDPKPGRLGQ
jgi:hypothetical protein